MRIDKLKKLAHDQRKGKETCKNNTNRLIMNLEDVQISNKYCTNQTARRIE